MCGVVERQILTSLTGHGHHLSFRDMMIQKEHLAAFADSQMRCLAGVLSQRADVIVTQHD